VSKLYHVYHPEQARAKWTVKNHLRRGKLKKPERCERCNEIKSKEQLEGHHWSYKKKHHGDPIWLCCGCHRIVHRELGPDWVDAETKPNLRQTEKIYAALEPRPDGELEIY
jgi:hypothetical protein